MQSSTYIKKYSHSIFIIKHTGLWSRNEWWQDRPGENISTSIFSIWKLKTSSCSNHQITKVSILCHSHQTTSAWQQSNQDSPKEEKRAPWLPWVSWPVHDIWIWRRWKMHDARCKRLLHDWSNTETGTELTYWSGTTMCDHNRATMSRQFNAEVRAHHIQKRFIDHFTCIR